MGNMEIISQSEIIWDLCFGCCRQYQPNINKSDKPIEDKMYQI